MESFFALIASFFARKLKICLPYFAANDMLILVFNAKYCFVMKGGGGLLAPALGWTQCPAPLA